MMAPVFTEKLDKKKEEPFTKFYESTYISLIVNLVLGMLFYYFSSHEKYYGGIECIDLKDWGIIFSLFCFALISRFNSHY